jgi:hypothetical protein
LFGRQLNILLKRLGIIITIKIKKMENITPDYVDFETAKLLKEKGMFPHSDNKSDWKNEPNHKFAFNENGEIYKTPIPRISNYEDYLAPEISLVVKWLYLKHKIFICLTGDCNYKFRFEIQTWSWYEPEETYRLGHTVLGESFWDTTSPKRYDTPEQAYLEAIKYTLTKLI